MNRFFSKRKQQNNEPGTPNLEGGASSFMILRFLILRFCGFFEQAHAPTLCPRLFLSVLLLSALSSSPAAGKEAPRVEDMSKGPVEVILTFQPPRVRLDGDMLLTLRVTAPQEISVSLPSLNDRLKGFLLSGVQDHEPVLHGGKRTLERTALLTPAISDEYRLAPLPIVYTDPGRPASAPAWFATRPVVFERVPVIDGQPASDIEDSLTPVRIYPPFKTVLLSLLAAVVLIGLFFLAWKLAGRIRRRIQLARMSPRERALFELEELLGKDLIARHQVKEFYLELTMIVRRYIERAHTIRAPEQTTEEFLAAVSQDTRFSREVVSRLRAFLEAADLVKFAADRPTDSAIRIATQTARDYVETDAAFVPAAPFREPGKEKG